MSEKKAGKRELVRAEKASIRTEIASLQEKIHAARHASRVPDRVVNGDAITAQNWKDSIEKAWRGAVYHASNAPAQRATVKNLASIREKLNSFLREIE
jgi:hypothetical protein